MKHKVVVKFGGTSVKTASAIKEVTGIIANNPNIQAVVVSAVGGVTNLLIEFFNSNIERRNALTKEILKIHLNLIEALELCLEQEIHSIINKMQTVDVFDNKGLDYIVAMGEDLSSLIITAYLQKEGIEALHIDARSFMITDNHSGKATPQLEKIKAYNFPQRLFVTQGFIGATEDGITTTLGRGGSDYSAALIAEAINADKLFIYTDVSGVYTSDPNRVEGTRLIPELTFQEMAEMANFGAKILHPATLEPCIRAGIPIRILSSFEREGGGGTLVKMDDLESIKPPCIKAITMRYDQFLITIKSLKMIDNHEFIKNIFSILADHKMSIDLISTSEVSVAFTIDGTRMGLQSINPFIIDSKLLSELDQISEIIVEEGLTLLAVVGHQLRIPGIIQKILRIIEPHKVRLVCYGASNSSIGILVSKDNADFIANLLHKHLLGAYARKPIILEALEKTEIF